MMQKSEQIGDLITALAKAQLEFGSAFKQNEGKVKGTTKTGNAYEYSYKYADLAANIDAVRPALNKYEIALMQFPSTNMEAKSVSVVTILAKGDQWISSTLEAPASDTNGFHVQSIGKATTYCRRYGLQALVGLASEDDDGSTLVVDQKDAQKYEPAHASQEPGMYDKPDKKYEPAPKVRQMLPKKEPSPAEYKEWRLAFDEAKTLDELNQFVPLCKERGMEFTLMLSAEGKKRGYTVNSVTGKYEAAK